VDSYVILRRSTWASLWELEAAAARARAVGDGEMSGQIRWIRSYVLEEERDRIGTVCVYEASGPEAIREHARRAELAADEVIPVADTVIVRPDPEAGSA
jgi:thiamine biosynthesis protein ThiC